ncbi:MAG: NCS2 family permease, partial [Bacteroidales bacterium]|nr:NCS2 family permease [Bacteroidales bacterium]
GVIVGLVDADAPGLAFLVDTFCNNLAAYLHHEILIEGIIFIILTLTKVRQWILNSIPMSLKNAIGAGIGLFIAFIGLQNAGLIVNSDSTLVTLGDVCHGSGLLAVIGIFITAVLLILKVRGGILLGILITALLGLLIKDPATGVALTHFSGVVDTPPSVAPIFAKFEWGQILSWDMLAVVFTFLFIDMFDTMGTVIGVSQKAGFVDESGNVEDIDKVFMADSIGTVCGACLGTSTTTTYVESSAGVGEGGRTGLTAFSVAICFALALFFAPIFLGIPSAATAPALILVGVMMMEPVVRIDWTNFREAIPAFVTLILMPVAYSISDGILIGMITYVVLNALTGKAKEVTPTMYVLAALFIARYIFI